MAHDNSVRIEVYEEDEDFCFYRVKGVDVEVLGWNDKRRSLLTPDRLKSFESYLYGKMMTIKQVVLVEKFLDTYEWFKKEFKKRKRSDAYIEYWVELYTQLESIEPIFRDYLNRERANASYKRNKGNEKLKKELLMERYTIGGYEIEVNLKDKKSKLLFTSVRRSPIDFDVIFELNKYVKIARSKDEADFSGFKIKIESAVVSISFLNDRRFSPEEHKKFWQEFTSGLSKYAKYIAKFRDWRRKQKPKNLVVNLLSESEDVPPWRSE